MGTPKDSEKTKAKIIDAAGRLFAEKGLKGVTVRDIAQKAETPVSALNYHFRTKEALYREVLLSACDVASISESDRDILLWLKPQKALLIIIKEALKEYHEASSSNWQTVILTRECWEPSTVFEEVVDRHFKPETDLLAQILGKVVNQPHDSHQVRFAVIGLFGLLETFGLYDHLIEAVAPGLIKHGSKKDWMAKQILHMVIEAASLPEKK